MGVLTLELYPAGFCTLARNCRRSVWEPLAQTTALVVADSAYPAQCRQGIETIVADEEQTTVLDRAHAILSACKHLMATAYTDRELAFVREEDAPGVSSYREKLGRLLKGYGVCALPHEEIISKLHRVAEKFRVLLIKSNMRIPYTSVFFELECGYWNAEAEKRLRGAIRSRGRRTAAKPKHR